MTFQEIYEEIQSLTGDSSSGATIAHKRRLNATYKILLAKFNKRTERTLTTIANQQSYELPNNLKKLSSVKLTVGTVDYPLTEIVNEEEWNNTNSDNASLTSDIQTNYYIKDDNILLYPTPATDGYVITFYYSLKDKDLSADNYTTGKVATLPYTTTFTVIVAAGATSATLSAAWALTTGSYQIVFSNNEVRTVTLTNGSAAVSWTTGLTAAATATITINNTACGSMVIGASGGNAPVWTAAMVGRFLKINDDGYWYKIYSFVSATHITLQKKFLGTTIASGTADFTISEIPQILEEYHPALIYWPCCLYFLGKRDEGKLADIYKALYKESRKDLPEEDITTSRLVFSGETELKNPADYPRI